MMYGDADDHMRRVQQGADGKKIDILIRNKIPSDIEKLSAYKQDVSEGIVGAQWKSTPKPKVLNKN